ncbi:MAG: hypothetical protein RRB12_09680, partial [Armatimonadota bacterium]|nr:hypothetical protein [Armatimonadota bacterium]
MSSEWLLEWLSATTRNGSDWRLVIGDWGKRQRMASSEGERRFALNSKRSTGQPRYSPSLASGSDKTA